MTLTIMPIPEGIAPLYCRYPRQTNPQGAHVSLDLETGEVAADWNAEIGYAVPERVFDGLVRRYNVPAAIRGERLLPLVESLLPLLERVYLGSDVQIRHDRRRIVTLDDDARSAEAELSEIEHDEASCWAVWTPGDWLEATLVGDLMRDGETIEAATERLDTEALGEGVYLDGDVEQYLRERIAR